MKLDVKDSFFIYLAGVFGMLLLSLPQYFLAGDAALYYGYFAPQAAYIAAIAVYLKIKKIPLGEAVPVDKKLSPLGFILCVAITAGVYLQNVLPAVSFNWLMSTAGAQSSVSVPDVSGAGGAVLGLVLICVLPSIGEEAMFRGTMLSGLRATGTRASVALSALIFALSHFNTAQIVHQFLLGIVLAYMAKATGSVLYGAAVHFLNNTIALFLPLIIPTYNNLAAPTAANVYIMLGMCLAGILILYPSLFAFVRVAGKKELAKSDSVIFTLLSKKETPLWQRAVKGALTRSDLYVIIIAVAALTLATAATALSALAA